MIVKEKHIINPNSGKCFECLKGEKLKVEGTSTADLVAFNLHDLIERFDQARTKVNQGKIFISEGDYLYSKRNRKMMLITEDLFKEGHHDLQHGMCSRSRWELLVRNYGDDVIVKYYKQKIPLELPNHGCWENLTSALKPWNIHPDDIPSPFNLFQDTKIDSLTGKITNSIVRPKPGCYVMFQMDMDCLVAISTCPDLIGGGGKEIIITIYKK